MQGFKVIPYVCSAGGKTLGSETGASDIKKSGLIGKLAAEGMPVEWYVDPDEIYDSPWGRRAHENLPARGTQERNDIVFWHCAQLKNHVRDVIRTGDRAITIGGDHAMALGSIAGLAEAKKAQGRVGVLWVDAHADFNTPETSPSQALHGMPLAALSGLGDKGFVSIGGEPPAISPQNIAYIGLRDVDPGELDFIQQYGIAAFTMKDIEREGLDTVFAKAKQVISTNTDAIAFSIDLDAFDPSEAPSVGTPVENGLHKAETLPLLRALAEELKPELMEITEYNPTLDGRETTFSLVEDLLGALLPQMETA